MKETAELRVDEEFAPLLFAPSEGKRLGTSIRRISIDTSDPRFRRAVELQRACVLEHGRPFVYGWDITRKYTKGELASARLFSVIWTAPFEPVGEQCGTTYETSRACQYCGVGSVQLGPLVLDGRTIPRSVDFAQTIANERIVSERARQLFIQGGVAGADWHEIRYRPAVVGVQQWHQMSVATSIDLVPPTLIGNGPFSWTDDERCPLGHVAGLNLFSEVTVRSKDLNADDIIRSAQLVGTNRGVLRPAPVFLVRSRVRDLVLQNDLKGWRFEIANIEN